MPGEQEIQTYVNSLDIAIKKEQESNAFYKKASETVTNIGVREFFRELMEEEIKHEKILTDYRDRLLSEKKVDPSDLSIRNLRDLGISRTLLSLDMDDDTTIQDALIIAMKREEKAVELFHNLALTTPDAGLKALFEKLREEEIKHLKRIESIYDDVIYTDN